jgi:hypothetical protein
LPRFEEIAAIKEAQKQQLTAGQKARNAKTVKIN